MDRYPCGILNVKSANDIYEQWKDVVGNDDISWIQYLLDNGYLIKRKFDTGEFFMYWIAHPNESDNKEYGGLISEY